MIDAGPAEAFPTWIGVDKELLGAGASPLDCLVTLPAWRIAVHALILGTTGCGKTNLAHHLIAQAAAEGRSFVVLDLRGDLVHAAKEILSSTGTDAALVEILDLRDAERPRGYDPLRGSGEPYFAALGVWDAIEAEHDKLGPQLGETLRYALLALAERGFPLTRIEQLFYDRGFRAELLEGPVSASVSSFWERYDALSAERQQALAMPVTNKLSALFATEGLRRTLGGTYPIDLRRHLDTPGSVLLVSLAADQLHSAGRMVGRMLLSSIWREVTSRLDVPEARRNRVLCFVDEFEHFTSPEFETVLVEGRKWGMSLLAFFQSLSQLSPRMRTVILGNVGAKVIFRLGRDDASALSLDLTGDRAAIDLANLPTGECVLWTRDGGLSHVEVNEPIVKGGAPLSRGARALAEAVRSRTPNVSSDPQVPATEAQRTPEVSSRRPAPPIPASQADLKPRAAETAAQGAQRPLEAMEDWLS